MKKNKKVKSYGGFKRNLREEIIRVLEFESNKALNHKQVAAALGIKDSGVRVLIQEILVTEAEAGLFKEVERGKFRIASIPQQAFQGRIEINRFGRGYVTIEGRDKDIEIPKGETGFAFWGDTVEISFNPRSRRPSGRVLRVVQRMRNKYIGILKKTGANYFMLPSDSKVHVDFFIDQSEIKGAQDGDKVIVELIDWNRPDSKPFGRVTQVLGKPGEHETEIHAIIAEFNLPEEFPEDVHTESEKIPNDITPEEVKKRRDFRGVVTFTIDPYDAKDFDDALSFKRLENGHVEVGIHIADVSHYLQENTLLEAEAFNRATSVYLVDRTIPMLPERLSNFLCSLRPDEDKLCFSAVFDLDENANIHGEWFGRTVIRSQRRFTYEEAQEIIETKKGDYADEVLTLDKLAKKLREKRFESGSMDFNSDEVKFKLDEKGKPLGVFVKTMKDSNQLIEDFMLLANRKVAEFIGHPRTGQARTFVYRIHDTPVPEKLDLLRVFVKHLGYKLPRLTDAGSGGVIKSLMRLVEGQPEEGMVRTMAIRSMAKAEYSTDNIGHYGLAFKYYTHFTSPIRRYPDVLVHRLLQRYLDGGTSVDERDYEFKCRHSSLMEKRASDAERASIKFKQVEYMLMSKGQEFEGIISGIAGWGMYVEIIENKCEGLVPIDTLTDDHYTFDESRYILSGSRKRKEYHLGDPIRIRVVSGDIQRRTLNFEMVS